MTSILDSQEKLSRISIVHLCGSFLPHIGWIYFCASRMVKTLFLFFFFYWHSEAAVNKTGKFYPDYSLDSCISDLNFFIFRKKFLLLKKKKDQAITE